jgi:hypothetical protein
MCDRQQREQIELCREVERGLEALRRTEAAVAQVKRPVQAPSEPADPD